MKKFTECKIFGPARSVEEHYARIVLCDMGEKEFVTIQIPGYAAEKYYTVFSNDIVATVPLLDDFTSELLSKVATLAGYKVVGVKIEVQGYLKARIIFDNEMNNRELRVEDALALAGRNGYRILVESALLARLTDGFSPHKDPELVKKMKQWNAGLPDDFRSIDLGCGGWSCFKKN